MLVVEALVLAVGGFGARCRGFGLLRDSSKECGVAQGLVRVSADPVYVDSLCGDFMYHT